MSEEVSKNLSETLFTNHKQAKETSSLTHYMPSSQKILDDQRERDGSKWYRNMQRMQWTWQGVDPIEAEAVLAKIAFSKHSRSYDEWLDTVMGYHSGNWTYEWTKLGMLHTKRSNELEGEDAADELFNASLCFSIAGYPHLKNDNLASQAQVLASNAYSEAAKKTQYIVKKLEIPFQNKRITAHLHLTSTDKPQPVVMVSAGLDSLQTDLWKLFRISCLIMFYPKIEQIIHFLVLLMTCCLAW